MKGPVLYQTTAYQEKLLGDGTREQIIEWLIWNDPNGCYSDANACAADYEPLTLDGARNTLRSILSRS